MELALHDERVSIRLTTRLPARPSPVSFGTQGFFVSGSNGLEMSQPEAIAESGSQPDYDSGPHLALMAAAVRLARLDLADPLYFEECLAFLKGDLVGLLAECLHFEGSFVNAR